MKEKLIENPQRPEQFSLFDLLEVQDNGYSHFVEFFDNIPKFVDFGKKRYWDYESVKPSISTEFKFQYAGQERLFIVTLRPGRIQQTIDGELKDVLVYPSIQREETVYDGLRKLANSGQGAFFGGELGTMFTLRMLRKELAKYHKTLSLSEIKESLRVLRSAEINVKSVDGSFDWQPSYLSNMALTSREKYLQDGGDAKCVVLFDSMVSTSVKEFQFREFNYAIAQATKNAVAKYLTKRLDRRYIQASPEHPYTIKMSTIFAAIYRVMDPKMSNNKRHMDAAVKEMIDKCRIISAKPTPIKSTVDSRKTIDYYYNIFPSEQLISDVKRFHAKRRLATNKAAILYSDKSKSSGKDPKKKG